MSRLARMATSIGPGSPHSCPPIVMYHLMQQSTHPSTAILPSQDTLDKREDKKEKRREGTGGGIEKEEG